MTSNGYVSRPACPMCGALGGVAKPYMWSHPTAESLPFRSHKTFLPGFTARRVFFTYYRCGGCGGLYCPTYFSQAQLDFLYAHQLENMSEVPLGAREATQAAYFDLLQRHSSLEGKYLEIGPDIGLFAGLCAGRGRFSRFYLFEPNREVHASLTGRLAGHEVRVSAAAYDANSVPPETLSVAVLIHVLDHLADPGMLIRNLYDDLRPGGTVFIVTHNEASLLARSLGRRWPPYGLAHPQLFSPGSITQLLERGGFRVIEIRRTINRFPVRVLVGGLFAVLGLDRHAPRLGGNLVVNLRLGNIATVARKPG